MFEFDELENKYRAFISSLSVQDYCAERGGFSSIGAHFRHIIDFMSCLLKDWNQECINYDHRERSPMIENNPQFALLVFKEKIEHLKRISTYPDKEIKVCAFVDSKGTEKTFKSSLLRELYFLRDHALHHYATMQIISLLLGKSANPLAAQNFSTHLNRDLRI